MPGERLSRMILAAGTLGGGATLVLAAVVAGHTAEGALWAVPFLVAFAAGAVAFRLRPGNLAARRLLAFGAVTVVWLSAGYAALFAYDAGGAGDWLVPVNLVLQGLGLGLPCGMVALTAVYPDGAYHRRGERWLVRGFAALAVGAPLWLLLTRPELQPAWLFEWAGTLEGSRAAPVVDSPLYAGVPTWLGAPAAWYLDAALGAGPLAAAVVLARRHRGFAAEQRLQIAWPFYAALPIGLLPLGDLLVSAGAVPLLVQDVFEITVLILLPASLAIGLLWPRLFDLERMVRRSAVYVVLWVAIGGLYVGVAAALGLAAGGEGLQVAVAVTIVATLLFEPARRATARRAARWAYGEAIGGDELLRRLGATLEHTLETEELTAAIAETARDGIGAHWVRIAVTGGPDTVAGGPPRPGEPPALEAPLVHAGERLGMIACGPSAHGRIYTTERELIVTLAGQAALAIHNARLASELGTRLEELAASRARIVQAEERARRRIERDIHDGAQQELAALIARVGLARNQLRRDPGLAADTLADLQLEAQQALESLRRLASGIHPSVLSDRGIVEAIEARAARLPLGVTIECDASLRAARFAESVEGAVYFVVCECFANTLKHALAERVTVCVTRDGDVLDVAVSDDGRGFDPAARVRSSGLPGLTDRIAALGGELTVESSPGAGARVRARLPVCERALA